jgi:TIR domain
MIRPLRAMADIFISYAREDQSRAKALAEILTKRGWTIWWDRNIPTGKRFHKVIETELAQAKCVMVLWSAASVESDFVRDSKVKNASESCNLEQDDRILALIDLTAFGSAKNCIAFSTHTMYYHNTSKLLAIRYTKFPNTTFSVKADKITDRGLLADDTLLEMGGYGHSVKDVLVLLNAIKATAAEAPSPAS